ncbi:uncharacterized protein LOC110699572 [Chenopodium quinoa]|uniref:uncharacterized protein LOC110699572 n=1 Tax=Chenopodium quinoa TaxID=63459 RepID=UPI000B7866CC|nr:uncharacterized protein LOC110699572 [Chenopodium quinoa]
MHRARDRSIVPFDPEIRRTLSKRRIASGSFEFSSSSEEGFEEELGMGDQPRVALKELGIPGAYMFESRITPPTTPVNDFEIRPAMVALIERRKYSVAKNESRALEWLDKEVKPNSLLTWDEVTKEFLSRFYPQKKTAEARALIQGFKQRPNESLYEACERYKEYQRECPHHGILTYQVIQIFYGGLSPQGKSYLDGGAGGPIMNRTEEEVVDIIEDVVKYYRDWQDSERDLTSKSGSLVYSIDHLNAIKNLSSQMTNLGKEMTAIKAKLEGSFSSQASNSPSQFKGRGTFSNSQPPPSSNNMPCGCLFCDACGPYDHDSCNCPHASPECGDDFDNSESEHVNDVSNNNEQRSGKVLEERLPRRSDNKEVPKEVLVENEGSRASLDEVVVETPREVRVEKEIVKPKLPYPQKFMRHKLDEKFGRFIYMLKQLHLSLPFTDVINQMPNYAKFLKDILSRKRICDCCGDNKFD